MLGTPWMFMSYGNLFFTPHHPTHCEFEHVMVLTTWAQGLGQQWLRLALQRPLQRQCHSLAQPRLWLQKNHRQARLGWRKCRRTALGFWLRLRTGPLLDAWARNQQLVLCQVAAKVCTVELRQAGGVLPVHLRFSSACPCLDWHMCRAVELHDTPLYPS